jgi:rSAM/selenodomain-associated transferase 2
MKFSVIIPTLEEQDCLGETLRLVRRESPHEILVSDGGSSDRTCEIAAAADRLVHAPRGRAAQMNFAAAEATGDALLFLHADCVLEAGSLAAAASCLRHRGIAAGCLRMEVKAPGSIYRWIDAAATARVRLTGIAYGDQGLFLRRELFERVGGFPPLRFMEDVFMSRALRKHGRVVVAAKRVFVSPRRWTRHGVVSQTIRNWTLTALAVGGVHPDRLARFYPANR